MLKVVINQVVHTESSGSNILSVLTLEPSSYVLDERIRYELNRTFKTVCGLVFKGLSYVKQSDDDQFIVSP